MTMPPKPAPKPDIRAMTWRIPVDLLERLAEYKQKAFPRVSVNSHVEQALR
jgi:hypothetical protein